MSNNPLKNLKLLYVEDEANVRKYALSYFNRIFETTLVAKSALEALNIFKSEKPHIIVTDIKMEEMSGLELLKKIRQEDKKCQIVVLSAFLDTKYLLEAIELNLVKYLTKPIKHEDIYPVLLKCANNLRELDSDSISFSHECYFKIKEKVLINKNEEIKLSNNERTLLELLCINKDRIVSYEEIENIIWYDSIMSENALRTLVKKLRKKLPKDSLINISKLGYKIRCL
ncbi:DNA-binding response regulator [Arcobacter sp. CECT 8983]|uniref:response regulator transcription factor n=1 Tax=Arcobacter sp. CECT 8983 TaxID=2044508 RepID=UPI00100B9641|nr:response regulator [Arcobacter sp. CECT 8983]RXJ88472.1 DNA-binding response regulator [Arcobacter sp. CECT 8983]